MAHQANAKALFRDANRAVEDRVSDLLARMTLNEKLAQLGSRWVYELFEGATFSEAKAQALLGDGIGQITRIGGASNVAPKESAELANAIQKHLLDHTRLGIPAMVHEESCSGYMALGATCFPQIIGVASTWEPELVEKMTAIIRTQMRAVGAHHALAPVLDVVRDPRWGRVEETFGEDPYLVARMGTAYVKGLQGEDLSEGVIGTGKHFVGYGVTEGGMNWAPAHVGQRELLEVFLLPFETAIKQANLGAIMNAYHEIDGVACATSKEIFRHLLRGRLGFEGIVVSDYFAIAMIAQYHHVARDRQEAATLAMEAGIDIELPSVDCYGDPLRQALADGLIDMALIDEAVGRVLRMKFLLGLFENPYVNAGQAAQVFDTPQDRATAREIAQKSIVLLKNENNLLPLRKDLASIAVIGPNAASERNLMGDYSYPAHIETLVMSQTLNTFGTATPEAIRLVEQSVPMVSVLEGIRAKLPDHAIVRHAAGCDVNSDSTAGFAEAVELAAHADLAIVVVGDKAGLTPDYNHKPSGGRSHWYGDYVDSPAAPLFPFGHGLSYTRFAFDNLKISPAQARVGETVTICVDVANVGERSGDEVVQLYVHDVIASVTRPVKELKGFKRISLKPGEKRRVAFHLGVNQLAFYDRDMAFVVEPGTIEVMVGSSSQDIHCTGAFEIVGERVDVSAAKVYFSAVEVS